MLWSPMFGLQIRVNGLQINSTFTKTLLQEVTSSPVGLFIGCDISGSSCTAMDVDDVLFTQNIEDSFITKNRFSTGLLCIKMGVF